MNYPYRYGEGIGLVGEGGFLLGLFPIEVEDFLEPTKVLIKDFNNNLNKFILPCLKKDFINNKSSILLQIDKSLVRFYD